MIVSISLSEVMYVEFYLKSQGSSSESLDKANLLRLLRVSRVVRVFNKLEDLHRILSAIKASVSPVPSAFLLFAVVLSIYAIVACNLFLQNSDPELQQRISTHYGSFSRAFVSLLGVATGFDSWTYEVEFLGGSEWELAPLPTHVLPSDVSSCGVCAGLSLSRCLSLSCSLSPSLSLSLTHTFSLSLCTLSLTVRCRHLGLGRSRWLSARGPRTWISRLFPRPDRRAC